MELLVGQLPMYLKELAPIYYIYFDSLLFHLLAS